MPPEPAKTETQPPADGAAQQPAPGAPAPVAPSAEDVQFEAFRKRLAPEFDALQKGLHAEKTARGRAEAALRAAREWDEDTVSAFTKAYGTHEGRRANYVKQGVPEEELDDALPTRMDAVAERWLRNHGKSNGTPAMDEAAMKAKFQEWMKEQNAPQPGEFAREHVTTTARSTSIAGIDSYAERVKRGDKFSPTERDQMTAGFLNGA